MTRLTKAKYYDLPLVDSTVFSRYPSLSHHAEKAQNVQISQNAPEHHCIYLKNKSRLLTTTGSWLTLQKC